MKPGPFAASNETWDRYDTALVVRPSSCRAGVMTSASSLLTGSFAPIDPDRTLEDLVASGATITNAGTAVVRGEPTTQWNVALHPSPACTSASPLPELEVFTDSSQRMRRVLMRVREVGMKVPPITITTDLFDFGVPVHVEAPPPDQVMDITEYMAAVSAGPGKLDGEWRAVVHSSGGAAFTVWYGHTTTGSRCFDLEPNSSSFETIGNSRDSGPPRHDGHESQCLYPGAPPSAALQGFLARTTGDRIQIVVAFAPGYANAQLVHADGSTTAVPTDATTGIVDWTGPSLPAITKVQADGALGTSSCAISPDDAVDGGMLSAGSIGLPGACALSP